MSILNRIKSVTTEKEFLAVERAAYLASQEFASKRTVRRFASALSAKHRELGLKR
jgi:hypothetical protein